MQMAGLAETRIFLCSATDIVSCLPQLSCLKTKAVLAEGANCIDEAVLLAALPAQTARVVLIADDQSSESQAAQKAPWCIGASGPRTQANCF